MNVFIGMETSGALRRRFRALGHRTHSADLLDSEDAGAGHMVGDVFVALDALRKSGCWPDLAIFHPTCTYLTGSAAWAFTDGPYHQKLKPGTLAGAERRAAREEALDTVRRIMALPIARIAIENPIGAIGSRIRPADQIVQPHQFGDDASKATCLWLKGLPKLQPTRAVAPRYVDGRPRWANQTDSGQNRLSPSDDRWKNRSRTYPGIADAMAAQWGTS
jgi:hypothetical protein